MYCGNCGKFVEDGATFCGECGASVSPDETNNAGVDNSSGNVTAGNPVAGNFGTGNSGVNNFGGNNARTFEHSVPDDRDFARSGENGKPKKMNVLLPITIALICVCLAAAGTIIFLLLSRDADSPSEGDNGASNPEGNVSIFGGEKQSPREDVVVLTVDSCPAETMINPLMISGTMLSKENTAFLSIDGERVNSVSSIDGIVAWEEEVRLVEGTNTITVTLSDNAGNTDEQTITIDYTEAWPFPYGTELTRTSGEANYMILVRPGPSKQSGEPLLKIMPGDFTTTLIYLGEYQQENSPTDGVHNWYKVELPDGRVGWIREDLAMVK